MHRVVVLRLVLLLALVTPASSLHAYRNVVYFLEWGIYRDFHIANLDWSRTTHVNYAFAMPQVDGSISFLDEFAATQRVYGHDLGLGAVQGCFGQANKYKRAYRGTKFGLSFGGWSGSGPFPTIAASPKLRAAFVANAVALLEDLGLDFIDLDWEYPALAQLPLFATLLADMRAALDALPFRAELSIAAPGFPANWDKQSMTAICSHVDFLNLMTYEYTGAWSSRVGYHSNLFPNPHAPNGLRSSVSSAVQYYLTRGCPSEKLVMGVPLYGKSFERTRGLFAPFAPPTSGSHAPDGLWDYKDIALHASPRFDATAQATYAYNATTRTVLVYDDPKSVAAKVAYMQAHRLGGLMFWEASGDAAAGSSASLLTTYASLVGKDNMDFRPNNLWYPHSRYDNIRRPPLLGGFTP
ncbi:hypothetical protein SPRG_01030 [Saprolegnia parasitica CBS 223.65]|uniref:GH18 domain-containing protein n=1 Tax=Saprolegnia parasitica (strain CBS 223.65) TaxID=695850 RepID=A0A067CWS1_SAPPC|nr:hypothetical protein SPRG_01030 [Saprolegnia parasitica CBS 223.65]KDO34968.1 hypothetical protein SPRG_01030 [Saprolegnia parasitica CBS 223.65]|eukprot:XP_012194622.1 hypothetical protein SPRG_01030 [Saprolegnia parasitica CBS 223.65]